MKLTKQERIELKKQADSLLKKKKLKKEKPHKRRRLKKRKFKRPPTGLRPGGPSGQISHVGVRYHKGYVYDKLRYTCLTATMINDVDKELVEATIKTIASGPEAMLLPDGTNGWSFKTTDNRTYVLLFKNIEVALFYKRQLTEIILQPGDRHPEGILQDPIEAWQRLDLLGRSSKEANVVLRNVHQRLEQENKLLMSRVVTLSELNDKLEKDNRNLSVGQSKLQAKLRECTQTTKTAFNSSQIKPKRKENYGQKA